jgi:4-azaleucine resistance transporter AzlC
MVQQSEQTTYSAKASALRAAFPATIPVLTGYGCLGLAYGLLMSSIGYSPLWALAMSAVVYGGSIEYAAIPLLTSAFSPVQAFLLAVMVNARHIFYGLSLLGKYQGMGKARPYLIFSLTDETFSLISTLEPPSGVERKDFYFWISLLDHSYWTIGSFLGAVVGSLLTFDTTGLDFVLTALFVVLFLEQWKKKENRAAGVIGILCMAVSVAVFGGTSPVIPAMALILLVLLGGRKYLCD